MKEKAEKEIKSEKKKNDGRGASWRARLPLLARAHQVAIPVTYFGYFQPADILAQSKARNLVDKCVREWKQR